MTEEDIKKLQSTGGDALAATEKNILGNHLEDLWEVVSTLKGGRIDFVLDNAGFELYCDLVYGKFPSPFGSQCKLMCPSASLIPFPASRLSHSIWPCEDRSFPRQTNSVVRQRRHSQRLVMAHQLLRVRPSLPSCVGNGHGIATIAWRALEEL